MSEKVPITIIGGGVIGCAIAYKLSKIIDKDIFLIERNQKIGGENQSSRNSGVIHAGLYYSREKAPLKAEFCVKGSQMLYDFCREHSVPHKKTGKLVVATNTKEEEYIDALMKLAIDNGVRGIKKIDGSEARLLEPNINITAALYAPTSGIIDATRLVLKLNVLAHNQGTHFVTGNEVVDISPIDTGFKVTTTSGGQSEQFETDLLINAAGVNSDLIARMVNPDSPYEIGPIRGESVQFNKRKRPELVMNGLNVYPAPYGVWPNGEKADLSYENFLRVSSKENVSMFVGVHLTPTFEEVDGDYVIGRTVTIGPALVGNVEKEDYKETRPKEYYFQCVKEFFPGIKLDDIELFQTGIVAVLEGHNDFIIERDPKFPKCINCVGICSPGLTASLAIAEHVKEMTLNENTGLT